MATKLNDKYLNGFVGEHEYAGIAEEVKLAHKALHDGTCLGNDFIGWLNLPTDYDKEEFARIKAAAERIKKNTDVFVVIGIGGSYLGARAAIEFLTSQTTTSPARTPRRSSSRATPSAPRRLPSSSSCARARTFP